MRPLVELASLKGRCAIISGGTGHIGFAIAEALAELGADIILLDRSPGKDGDAAGDLSRRLSVKAVFIEIDLANTDDIQRLPGKLQALDLQPSIIVNSAALVGTSDLEGWAVPFAEQSIDTWRKALDINLTAAFALIQTLEPMLRSKGHGSIINIASIYALLGPNWQLYEGTDMGNPAAYAASKGGLVQLTRWLSTTLAPAIRVNAIAPGGIFRDTPEPFHSRYVERTPMGRMGREEDLKGAAAYLASDLSAYVTGQCLTIDGGWSVW